MLDLQSNNFSPVLFSLLFFFFFLNQLSSIFICLYSYAFSLFAFILALDFELFSVLLQVQQLIVES